MSLNVTIEVGDSAELRILNEALADKAAIHERVSRDALAFVREFGAQKSTNEHRTATALGARATGHLEKAYRGIEAAYDEDSARLMVPRATRLRAAFGGYTLTPTKSKYLTIPVNAESYGRRAGEFDDLTFLRVGPRQQAILARKDEEGNLETMYLLVTSVNIPEDDSLIPFQEIYEGARDSVELHLIEAMEGGLLS